MSAIIRAEDLTQFVENARTIAHEAKLRVTEGGFETKVVDPANVAMVSQTLDSAAFESYEFDGGVLGVSLERLADVIGMADSDELVHLTLDETTRTLAIEVGHLGYTLALIEPDSIRGEPEIPGVLDELNAKLVCEARELQHAQKAAGLCSDHTAYGASVDDEVFFAEAEGDTDGMRYEWAREDVGEGTSVDGDAHSLYSLDYLKDILKPISSGAEVSLHVGEEFPLFLDSNFADGHGDLRYMVAPRISSD